MSRILIIDDDENILHTLETVLQEAGYEVLATADGPQGIELFKEKAPDLVLLDLALPSISGLEVLKKIRELDTEAKVLIITGYGSEESSRVAVRYGAVGFLTKPVGVNALLQEIRSAIGP